MTVPLVRSARLLLGAAKKKPSQADLRRTISTAYYAAFDALARMCADEVVGSSLAKRALPEWRRVYRALNHGRSQMAFRELKTDLGGEPLDDLIEDFCEALEDLRLRRLEADYDPSALRLKRADVALLVDAADVAIDKLERAPADQRRRLAFMCVLSKRTST